MRHLIIISLCFMTLCPAKAWADVVVIIRQQAEAAGNYVRICDIARVEGPKEMAAEVAKTVLGPTPARGEVREITRWEIEHRLYEMGLAATVTFTGNDMVKVTGNGIPSMRQDDFDSENIPAQPIANNPRMQNPPVRSEPAAKKDQADVNMDLSLPKKQPQPSADALPGINQPKNPLALMGESTREQVTKAIANYLASRYQRPDVEVEVKLVSISGVIPADVRDITVEEALDGRIPGRASLSLRVTSDSEVEAKPITTSVDAEVYALAPVAAKPLYKGDVLTPRDVLVTRVKMKSGASYLPPDPKLVEGREVQRPLSAGTPILATDATPTAAVKRGETVIVDAVGKGWHLQANAKALGSGNFGDVIMVEDASTKAKYQARVTGYGKVTALARKNAING